MWPFACQPKIRSWRQKDHFEYAGAAGGFLDKYGYPFCRGRIMQLQLKKIIPTMIISIQDISFIQDDHLNIIINYLFDLAALCVNHQELQVKIIQDTCVFEITMTMHLGIENIDSVKYDTLKLLLKKYQGSIKIIHENQNLILSLLIPMQ